MRENEREMERERDLRASWSNVPGTTTGIARPIAISVYYFARARFHVL